MFNYRNRAKLRLLQGNWKGKEGKKASMVQFSKITGTQMRDSIKGGALMGSGEQETQANTEVDGGFRVTAMHPSGPQGNLSRQSRRMET